jgi:hypothetical protein
MAVQAASSVAITGGTINGTTVGATTVAAGSFSTLNSSGATRLGGLSGNQSLQVNNVASAVNYIQAVGATTTNFPAFQAQGSDTNVGFLFDAKGSGSSYFRAQGGAIQFQVGATASAVNFMLMSGRPTGNYPVLSAEGSDTNVGFVFNAKGNAEVAFQTSSIRQAQVSHTASAVNYLNLTGAATTASPVLSAQGSDTNIDLTLTPKGAGYLKINSAYSPNLTLTDAATVAWDTSTAGGQVATFTFVSTNRTMGAPTNLKNGAFYALAVIQNGGSNTLTWNSVFKWAAGTAPTLSTAAGAKDYFTFRSDGTNLYQQGISQAVA